MNRDHVIRMAHEADLLDPQHYGSIWADKIEAFSKLLASHVAEECAKECEREIACWQTETRACHDEVTALKIATASIRSLYKPTA